MDYQKYTKIKALKDLKRAMAADLTAKNYDGGLLGKGNNANGESWCLSELIRVSNRETCIATCMLGGTDERGKPLIAGGKILQPQRQVKIKVISRQGCHIDADGKAIEKNPVEDDCISHDDKPLAGDVVRVKGDKFAVDPETGEPISDKGMRDMMQIMGRDTYEHFDYVVDADGCITCDLLHGLQLLQQNGFRICGRPEFKKWNSSLLDRNGRIDKKQRRISNWWYKEVALDYKETKKRASKPKQNKTADTETEQS